MPKKHKHRGEDLANRRSRSDDWRQLESDVLPQAADYKLTQLCAQVEQAVALALAESLDAVLRDLYCVGVAPLRGSARLTVTVETSSDHPAEEISERLERARGYLRSRVADSIHRKRTPDLAFVVRPPQRETS